MDSVYLLLNLVILDLFVKEKKIRGKSRHNVLCNMIWVIFGILKAKVNLNGAGKYWILFRIGSLDTYIQPGRIFHMNSIFRGFDSVYQEDKTQNTLYVAAATFTGFQWWRTGVAGVY